MTLREKEIKTIVESVTVLVTIQCDNCSAMKEMQFFTEDEAGEHFHNEGWRAPRSLVYCPKCAAKKLKPLQNRKKRK